MIWFAVVAASSSCRDYASDRRHVDPQLGAGRFIDANRYSFLVALDVGDDAVDAANRDDAFIFLEGVQRDREFPVPSSSAGAA